MTGGYECKVTMCLTEAGLVYILKIHPPPADWHLRYEAVTLDIEWMVWAAHVFLRTLAGTCPPVCPSMRSDELRFKDQ